MSNVTSLSKNAAEIKSLKTSIGSRIRQARKARGMNQAELATRLGVSQPTVANWESGVHDPRQLTLAKIAEALEVKLAWLASGDRSTTEKDKHPAAAYIRRGLFHVPIVALDEAMQILEDNEQDLHEIATDYIPVTASSGNLFSFFVNDEAMNLAFPGNTLAVVDYKHKVPASGDIVLLRLADGSPLLRRWRRDPERLEPYSSDPSHDTMYIENLSGIIGTVIVSIRFH